MPQGKAGAVATVLALIGIAAGVYFVLKDSERKSLQAICHQFQVAADAIQYQETQNPVLKERLRNKYQEEDLKLFDRITRTPDIHEIRNHVYREIAHRGTTHKIKSIMQELAQSPPEARYEVFKKKASELTSSEWKCTEMKLVLEYQPQIMQP